MMHTKKMKRIHSTDNYMSAKRICQDNAVKMTSYIPDHSTQQKTTTTPTLHSNAYVFRDHSAITALMAQLFNDPAHSDVVVHVGKQSFYLHRLLLFRSPVLRCMLTGKGWNESSRAEFRLEEDEMCIPYAESFLRYIYTSEVHIDEDNVSAMLILANKYDLPELERFCESFAHKQVFNGTNIERIIQWWLLSERLTLPSLFRKCKAYMLLNMDKVLNSDMFMDITRDGLVCLLIERDLVVSSEFAIYTAIREWSQDESRCQHYEDNSKILLSLINFCMMSQQELLTIKAELEAETQIMCYIAGQLEDAFVFHSTSFIERCQDTHLCQHDRPRLYTGSDQCSRKLYNSTLKSSPYCSVITLRQFDHELLKDGLKQKVSLPLSNSNADQHQTKDWCLTFKDTHYNRTTLDISTTLGAKDDFGTVESSLLIYKHVRGVTFVKGIMQLRLPTSGLPEVQTPQKFTMALPSNFMDLCSPYQIPLAGSKDCSETVCMFKFITRHYHRVNTNGQ